MTPRYWVAQCFYSHIWGWGLAPTTFLQRGQFWFWRLCLNTAKTLKSGHGLGFVGGLAEDTENHPRTRLLGAECWGDTPVLQPFVGPAAGYRGHGIIELQADSGIGSGRCVSSHSKSKHHDTLATVESGTPVVDPMRLHVV